MKLTILPIRVALLAILLSGIGHAVTPVKEKFKGSKLNKTRWSLKQGGSGKFAPKGGVLAFAVASKPTGDDYGVIGLKSTKAGYDESWELVVDVKNSAAIKTNDQSGNKVVGVGFGIGNAADDGDAAAMEFYGKSGVGAIVMTDGRDKPGDDILVSGSASKASLRISFDKVTKLVTFWWDANGAKGGYQWQRIGTFSPTGKGGDRRGNWKMKEGGEFEIQLYAYAEKTVVAKGAVSLDNFMLKGVR